MFQHDFNAFSHKFFAHHFSLFFSAKMEDYLKAAEAFIQSGQIAEAEEQMNRASMMQANVEDQNLLTKYKVITLNRLYLTASLSFSPFTPSSSTATLVSRRQRCAISSSPTSPRSINRRS
jgi:hypothetical protein